MKKTFDRIAKSQLGKRGLAVALCLVVLIFAIGVGSALTSLVSNAYSGSENPIIAAIGVVVDGAKLNLGNADEGAISRKGDADLASTGWGANDKFHYSTDGGSTWNDIVINSSTGEATITLAKKSNLRFEWNLNGATFQLSSSSSNFGLSDFASTTYMSRFSKKDGGNSFSTDNVPAGKYTFKIDPSNNDDKQVYVKSAVQSYTISYDTPTNGSFTTAPTSANAGSTVTVVTKPATGYSLSSATVTGVASPTVSGNNITFTMPSSNVTVSATFTQENYNVTYPSSSEYTVEGLAASYHCGDAVSFTVTPAADYRITGVSATGVSISQSGSTYSFTMPAANVPLTINYASTSASTTIYFKSATAWVYQPYITINDGAKIKMTEVRDLNYTGKHHTKPYSSTGSLRFAWYKADLTGVDVSRPVTVEVSGEDSWMEATGTFTISAGQDVYLACDNISDGNTLVDLTKYSPAGSEPDQNILDFYDTPLHMVATAEEIAAIKNSGS